MRNEKLIMELMNLLISDLDTSGNNYFDLKDNHPFILEWIQDALRLRNLNESMILPVSEKLWDCLLGRALLIHLFKDPLVSDLKVLAPFQIRIKSLGKRTASPFQFQTKEQYSNFIKYLLFRNGLEIKSSNTFFSFYDTDLIPDNILSCHISFGQINSPCSPYLQIHRISTQKQYMENLISSGILNEQASSYLTSQARNGGNILFIGNNPHKNTLLRILMNQIPHNKSAMAIQEQEEFYSIEHPEIIFQHPASLSQNSHNMKELMEYGLLMDSDYFILDELNSENVLAFWKALHHGIHCWAHLPVSSVQQALELLTSYLNHAGGFSPNVIRPSLSLISCIVNLKESGSAEIMETQGFDKTSQTLRFAPVS